MERKKLSKSFYADEFQCPCCGHVNVSPLLVKMLQQIRDKYGLPMRITSGTRCESHNKKVGGKSNSDHLIGYAADIDCDNAMHRRELILYALEVDVPTIGVKKDCIHLSLSLPPRVFTYD